MSTYPEYYPKVWWSDTNDEPEKVRGHLGKFSPPTYIMKSRFGVKQDKSANCMLLDHCIEILRMNLMCMADVNVFTFHPVEGKEGYWPDYESKHVCRNFEGIQSWARENAVPDADV